MKKTRNQVLALILVGVLALSLGGLAGCLASDPQNDGTNAKQTVSFTDAYDYSALGGISLLNATSSQPVSLSSVKSAKSAVGITPQPCNAYRGGVAMTGVEVAMPLSDKNDVAISDSVKAEILNNLAVAQTTISGGVVKCEVTASDREGYEYTYTISAADITGEPKTYVFYYNSIAGEDEEETLMEGIVLLDGTEYGVRGERKIEEDEEEIDFKVTLDENNYVLINQEVSAEEQEFKYSSYQNGVKVFETKVEYEADDDGEIELKFKTKADGKEIAYKYEFFSNENGTFIEVKMEQNETGIRTLIRVTTDEYGNVSYEFTTDEAADADGGDATSDAEVSADAGLI